MKSKEDAEEKVEEPRREEEAEVVLGVLDWVLVTLAGADVRASVFTRRSFEHIGFRKGLTS